MDLTISIANKKLQQEALIILFDNLNNKIQELEPDWINEDESFFYRMGLPSPNYTFEPIAVENFHSGVLAPLIDRPITEFPNVCVVAYDANPKRTNDDWADEYLIQLAVEIMVKSETSEDEVNVRINNTLDAAHRVFFDNDENRSLNGMVSLLQPPRLTIGDVFVRREGLGTGKEWYWQGGRLIYNIDKFTRF